MDILEFLFALLAKYAPMADSKLKRLMLDGRAWYDKLGSEEGAHPLLVKFKFFSEQWYIQLVVGMVFLWADKELYRYVNAPKGADQDDDEDDEEEDDDQDDEEEDTRPRGRRRS